MPESTIDFEQLFFLGPPCVVLKADPPKYTIVSASKSYLSRSRSTLQEFQGKEFFNEFLKQRLERDSEGYSMLVNSFNRIMSRQEPELIPYLHLEVRDGGGNPEHSYLRIQNTPILNHDGELEYIMHTVIDISDAVEDAQKKQSSFELVDKQRRKALHLEERLRLAIDSAQLGTWLFDLSDKQLTLSGRAKDILGISHSDTPTAHDVIENIDENYRDLSQDVLQAALKEKTVIDLEVPFINVSDNKHRWVKITGQFYPNNNGNHGRLAGTIIDNTERKLEDIRKNDFITIVSHELKTPLTVIKAYVQMLRGKAKKNADDLLLVSINKIHVHVEKMRGMISGFLDVSRVESGKLYLSTEQFNLSDLIKQTIDETDVITKQNPIVLDLEETVTVIADKEKITQVMSNLISNGIKYSAVGSTIEVHCTTKNNEALVSVTDYGIGIAPQDISKLFNRFYRVENENTRNISGFGIGLYLCSEIIKRHNGRIWVESTPGKGSTFYFSLPTISS